MNYSFNNYRYLDKILYKFKLGVIVKFKDRYKTTRNIRRNSKKTVRALEIGPGVSRLNSFETLNIIDGKEVDYITDISQKLPFADNTFDLIYASHVIEHVPWFLQKQLFIELHRVIKPGGSLEIWVPDFGKILEVANAYIQKGENNTDKDGWYRFNDDKDVLTWVNGRIFTYGDGTANPMSFNWHRCVFTFGYLKQLLSNAGFVTIEAMEHNEIRGVDHGWINLGIKATKKA